MGAYFTPGFATVQGDDLNQSARVPVDTGQTSATGGPQSGAMIPGTLILAGAAFTAKAGGTKAAATQLGYGMNEVAVCATAADSVLLPYAFPGAVCVVSNDGAASVTMYGKGTDTIDAVATATGNAMAAAKRTILYGISGTGDGTDAGAWVSITGAKAS